MREVEIAYDPDLSKIGKTIQVEDDVAREMVRTGAARYPEPKPKPKSDE